MDSANYGVCTIAAKNYASQVRTLFGSLRKHQPNVRCWALLVDDWRGFLDPAGEPYAIVSLGDLHIPEIDTMAFQYNVTEFSTAVKPFLLEHLLTHAGVERLVYLDPDILVTGRLDQLVADLDRGEYCVTPHLDTDYPNDARLPNDASILRSGILNLGFLAIRRSAASLTLLRWWQDKLRTKCVIDCAAGYFVDQRFMDLALALFPGFYMERGVGYNVAYWNLHSRHLSEESGCWRCNGGPLHFFHFSGYSVDQPDSISRYMTRYRLSDRPDVRPLFDFYARCLRENDHDATRRWAYTFGSFRDGETIPDTLRTRYRAALESGLAVPDPFRSREKLEQALAAIEPKPPSPLKAVTRNLTPPALWNLLRRIKRSLAS